ncbi:MAG: NAD(P)/FAD-dependent oxidoreductase [Flavobacteriales bacterium]
MKVAIIGGGAAGFFTAISAKAHHPEADVHLLERSNKLLAKVKVSGGGRCNVTHNQLNNRLLSQYYPRGEKFLRIAFEQFSVSDTVQWFESRGVQLKTEADNRMFPVTNDSQTIIDSLTSEARGQGTRVRLQTPVSTIYRKSEGFSLSIGAGSEHFDKVIIATGGSPKREGLQWLAELGHEIVDPVPSLFTFNMPKNPITHLMGVSVPNAQIRIVGSKLSATGPLLITHWGISGPAVLKTSAYGARELAQLNYNFKCAINWLGGTKEHLVRSEIEELLPDIGKRKITNRNPFELPSRLWDYFLNRAEVDSEKPWNEIGKKSLNKLINTLVNDEYEVKGKTTFKEEFVTAGGVSLDDIDPETMQSKVVPGLYFAGEVMDIDGVTGGFNFQAAWTTGFIAGKLT